MGAWKPGPRERAGTGKAGWVPGASCMTHGGEAVRRLSLRRFYHIACGARSRTPGEPHDRANPPHGARWPMAGWSAGSGVGRARTGGCAGALRKDDEPLANLLVPDAAHELVVAGAYPLAGPARAAPGPD